MTPLEYFICTMRDATKDERLRLDAAKGAADYCHRRQPQAHEVSSNQPLAGIAFVIPPLTAVVPGT